MQILLFLSDELMARSWLEDLERQLLATVQIVTQQSQFLQQINHHFDFAIVSMDLPDEVVQQSVDELLNRCITTIVHAKQFSPSLRDLFAHKMILDYVVGQDRECVKQLIENIKRYQHNQHTTVLVVDDSAVFRTHLSMSLQSQGLKVLVAEDGEQAMSMLLQSKVRIMITDFYMPKMDGLALIKAARCFYVKNELFIIVLTASESSQSADFLKVGANDFLRKPFSREELISRVNQSLDLIYLMDEMHDIAIHDFLTHLYNRYYFLKHGEQVYSSHSSRYVALIDIDHFKRINDTWGHDVGDEAIRTLARSCQSVFEKDSRVMVARMGGEEFALLFVDLTIDEVGVRLEQFRAHVESTPVLYQQLVINQTISVGWVDASSLDQLSSGLTLADVALYQAKKAGRNKVVRYVESQKPGSAVLT